MFKDIKAFLKSKLFLRNLALGMLVLILFFSAIVFSLSKYTRHGDYIALHNLTKLTVSAAETLLKNQELNYVIIDSVYQEGSPAGLVINQNPYAGSHVKKGRNIYLYITSTLPPLVEMPDLVDKSLRQAKNLLDNAGLKTGEVRLVIDPLPGFVLKQTYKGKPIAPGAKIPKGSIINMEAGKGNTTDTLP
jgi:beta-lactam-binding protein with PASTA domain